MFLRIPDLGTSWKYLSLSGLAASSLWQDPFGRAVKLELFSN
jgi:hypothetical protein